MVISYYDFSISFLTVGTKDSGTRITWVGSFSFDFSILNPGFLPAPFRGPPWVLVCFMNEGAPSFSGVGFVINIIYNHPAANPAFKRMSRIRLNSFFTHKHTSNSLSLSQK
jgi:hypothetical protein